MGIEKEEQINLFEEKQVCFLGSAKVHLRHLRFEEENIPGGRLLDSKNVTRLLKIFELEGCLRLDVEHHIPALIEESELWLAIDGSSKLARADLLQRQVPPLLHFATETTVTCLHGRHRVAAAKIHLGPADLWWIVDLYSTKLSEAARLDIREEYSNARNFCDGDIFRQLRHNQTTHNEFEEGRWLARLSESKRKDLKQLQKRPDLKKLNLVLDELIYFVGLWPTLQIGTFHRLLTLKCPEELYRYLSHVLKQWSNLIDSDPDLRAHVDFQTVQLLQMRNPVASQADRAFIIDHMLNGSLFPSITDGGVRSRLLTNALKIHSMMPTLSTFFEDTKWLEPCAKVLRGLLPSSFKGSIQKALFDRFTGHNQLDGIFRLENATNVMKEYPGTEYQAREYGYQQLWLYAWRHFPDMVCVAPRKDAGKSKPTTKGSDDHCWQRLAILADELGFESPEISKMAKNDPDAKVVADFLCRVRPPEIYAASNGGHTEHISTVCELLRTIKKKDSFTDAPRLSAQDMDLPIERRCGRPYERSHEVLKSSFFLPNLWNAHSDGVSHDVVHRDIFFAFFGCDPAMQQILDNPVSMCSEICNVATQHSASVASTQEPSGRPVSSGAFPISAYQHRDGVLQTRQPNFEADLGADIDANTSHGIEDVLLDHPHLNLGPVQGMVSVVPPPPQPTTELDGRQAAITIGEEVLVSARSSSALTVFPGSSANTHQDSTRNLYETSSHSTRRLAPMHVESQSSLVPYGENVPGREQQRSMLIAASQQLRNGDLLALSLPDFIWNSFIRDDNLGDLEQSIQRWANTSIFAAFSPKSQKVQALPVENIHTVVKSEERDGILFVCRRDAMEQELHLRMLQGSGTEIRLEKVWRHVLFKRDAQEARLRPDKESHSRKQIREDDGLPRRVVEEEEL